MKRVTLLTLLSILFCVSPIHAEEATYQDLRYTLDENHLTAEVTLKPRAAGEIMIPEKIIVGQNTYTVTSIADRAFKGCKNLQTIVLPQSIERIYRSAFDGTGIMLNKENWQEGCLSSSQQTRLSNLVSLCQKEHDS